MRKMNYLGFIVSNEEYEIRISFGEFEESDPCQDLDGLYRDFYFFCYL